MYRSVRVRLLVFAVVVGFLFALEFVLPLHQALRWPTRLGSTLERGTHRVVASMRQWVARLVVGSDVAARLSELQAEVQSLAIDRAHLAALEEDNANLKAVAHVVASSTGTFLTTRVSGEDPLNPQTGLRLPVGAGGGVKPGAAVVSPEGVLVGLIGRVGPTVSTVELLTNRRTQVPVRIVGKEKTYALLESPDGLALRIDQLPKDVPVAPGDTVVSNLGREGVPAGLPIGTVLSVTAPAAGLWQQALVAPLVSATGLDLVLVFTGATLTPLRP